jgi:hypothetical protein
MRLVLGLLAAAQLVLTCTWTLPVVRRLAREHQVVTGTVVPPGEPAHVFVALRALLRQVPPDAPLLIVSTLPAVQYDYYVLPRPLRLLQALPDAWIELAERHAPDIVAEVRRRQQRLDERGALLTAERVAAALREVRFVLVAGPLPPELAAVAARLEPRAEQPGFALFAVR